MNSIMALLRPPSASNNPQRQTSEAQRSQTIDPFPGYKNIREIVPGSFVGTRTGTDEMVVLRRIPDPDVSDKQNQFRTNLERACEFRDENIVLNYTRGATIDGRPFLARKHVNGVPIDVYNRGEAFGLKAPPALTDVVKSFVRVCRAVYRAHSKGVLHGNIRPSNILTNYDGSPHLMDFGFHLKPGSKVQDDVAALGRLLFDLLRDRPSAPDSALTAIAIRATSKDKGQVYNSASALADDLESYLTAKPVNIKEAGLWQIFRNRIDRHVTCPERVAATGIICGLIVGLYFAFGYSPHSVVDLAMGQQGGSLIGNFFLRVWGLVAFVAALGVGFAAERLGKARTPHGTICCGVVAGLVAGIVAWVTGAGGAIAAMTNCSALVNGLQSNLSTDSLPKMAQSLAESTASASFVAGWLSALVPIVLGTGFGVLGAWASRFISLNFAHNAEMALTYIELSIPGQLALAFMAWLSMGWAAGAIPFAAIWYAPMAFIAWGCLAVLAIQHGFPAYTRAVCYLAGLVGVASLAGGWAWWAACPVYLVAIGLVIYYIQSPSDVRRNVFA